MKVGAYGERGSTSKRGLEADPPVGIGAEPLVRGSGGKAPETERFLAFGHPAMTTKCVSMAVSGKV